MNKSWRLSSRRTFLRGAGVAIGLPLLEAMAPAGRRARAAEAVSAPRRMACFYVPNGVANVEWIPAAAGRDYELSPTLQVLKEFKDDFSVISGICHQDVEPGHAGGDTFLTAANLGATPGFDYKNSISVDQVAAAVLGRATRFPSLELSRKGGAGAARKTTTMSFSREGVPLAAENNPRLVFERLFRETSASAREEAERRLAEQRSVLDIVQQSARSLSRRLGRNDQRKLDEYLTAVRAVEKQVDRSQAWMDVPKPHVDEESLNLDVESRSNNDLRDYLRTMFDLMFLAFQTDTTRVGTFQVDREVANHPFTPFLGFNDAYHGLSHHGGDPQVLKKLAQIDRFHLEQFAHFLSKMKAAEEDGASMLDRTVIVYGSGMNNGATGGHYATNLPILFAGGRGLGVQQGLHLAYRQTDHEAYRDRPVAPPLCNLFYTMLEHLDVPVESFAESTGPLSEFSRS
jgi:hypothetical protein